MLDLPENQRLLRDEISLSVLKCFPSRMRQPQALVQVSFTARQMQRAVTFDLVPVRTVPPFRPMRSCLYTLPTFLTASSSSRPPSPAYVFIRKLTGTLFTSSLLETS